jgi:hypothetical protein
MESVQLGLGAGSGPNWRVGRQTVMTSPVATRDAVVW